MPMKPHRQATSDSLSRPAQPHAKDREASTFPARSQPSAQQLLHELEVHQIELESQNAELRHAREETETLLEQFTDLYDFSPVGYFTLAADGTIRQANLTGARMAGIDRSLLARRSFALLLAAPQRDAFKAWLLQVFADHSQATIETVLLVENRPPLPVALEARLSSDGCECRAVVVDITARKQAEHEIRNLNRQLESRVRERTTELQETVNLLEGEIRNRRRLEHEILEISEREQCRLGQDLHDGLGQELSGIAMLGDVHARELKAESHPSAQAATHIAEYVRATIASTRRLAKGLYPIELDRSGLLLALRDLAIQTSHRIGIHCELRQTGAEPRFEKSSAIHIYRIVQECIANAVKHGLAHHITIESVAGTGSHTFVVTDNGVGFAQSAGTTGMGLHLMDYRSRLIGAEITVEHPAQGGCRITCRLKL